MAQVVSLLPLTAKGWVQSHSSRHGERGGEEALGKVFLEIFQFYTASKSPTYVNANTEGRKNSLLH